MQIIAPNPWQRLANAMRRIEERDAILRRLQTRRAHEWRVHRGLRRFVTRIRIVLWAWQEAGREQRRIHRDDSLHNV